MDFIRYILAVILGIAGLFVAICNWRAFWINNVKKNEFVSAVPLIGGGLICMAFVIMPNNLYVGLCWLAFIIDYGSLPLIIHTVVFLVKNKIK